MGNLLAIRTWTAPGTEVICERRAHIANYELASISAIAGCMPNTVPAEGGILTWDLIEPLIRPKTYYYAQTGLIELENTSNMHGGTVYRAEIMQDICERAHAAGLPVHLDGARIFNAAVALGRDVRELTRHFDSVMFCLSKGLGAPVGSMLTGSREFIRKAHVGRKMLGGGMRQAGVLAAAGLIALEEGPKNLPVDHQNARYLAEQLAQVPGVTLDAKAVVTNIVIFSVAEMGIPAGDICNELARQGVLCGPTAKFSIRMVTHCDVDRAGVEQAAAAVRAILSKTPA